MRIQFVIFDFDGTLFDTKAGILHCLRSAGNAFGLDTSSLSDWVIGPPADESAKRLMPHYSAEARSKFLMAYRECYAMHGWSQSVPYPGIIGILEWLRTCRLQVFICTSRRLDLTLKLLHHYQIYEYFMAIAADDPELKNHEKKHLLKGLVSRENIDVNRCVMVGDSKYDLDAARAVGLKVIAALYGYGKREELVASAPDATCESPNELPAIIGSL